MMIMPMELLITSVRTRPNFPVSMREGTVADKRKGVDGDRKRYRSDTYIYQRTSPTSPTVIRDEGEIVRNVPRNAVPVIHASKPGEEEKNGHIEKSPSPQKRKQEAGKIDNVGSTGKDGAVDALTSPATSSQSLATPKSPSIAEPRRFHFSRPILAPSSLINAANATTGKRSRLNNATTVFVERGHKRTRTEDVQMKDADASPTMETSDFMHEPPPRKLKLPGSDRKGPTTKKPVTTVKKDVPVSMKKDWAGDVDEITRNMNDFALQLIGENLAEIEERDKKEAAAAARREAAAASKSPQTPRFKPKVPAQRYAERHPEVVATQSPVPVGPTAGRDEYESGSDDDYVVETYVRVPVSSLSGNVDPEKVGLLVFDNEPDLELFHGEEGDSDDEWPEDDEDENGKSSFTAFRKAAVELTNTTLNSGELLHRRLSRR